MRGPRANVSRREAMAVVAVAVGATWLAGCARESTYRVVARHPTIDAASLRAIEVKVENAVRDGLYPGGAVTVRAFSPQLIRAVGVADMVTGKPARRDTYFDVASLTKPVVTATMASVLVAEGRLSWDDRVTATASVDDLLKHRAPMPANFDWRALEAAANEGDGASTLELCHRVLGAQDSSSYQSGYGNAGYFLLGAFLEEHAAQPLGDLLGSEPYRSAAIYASFQPLPYFECARAASDVNPGTPFDPLASWAQATRRPAGHSGLFASAGQIDMWTSLAMSPQGAAWAPALFELDSPTATRSRAFEVVPRRDGTGVAFRHTGYTGCVMWLDPERQLSLVLLTNRGGTHTAAWDRHVEELVNEVERGWANSRRH